MSQPAAPLSIRSPEDALKFLNDRVDFERFLNVPYRQREFRLERVRTLLARLGDPQDALPIIHVAGTKGKGSTAAMLGAILNAAGRRTGVFTSPHLHCVEERIALDGRPCSSQEFVGLLARVAPIVEAMDREAAACDPPENGPTYFDITTAMALLYFVEKRVGAAVLEVGLGGRLDSTNVCRPQVAAITSISFDHTDLLGNTLPAIAREKAGIIKPGVPVVSGVQDRQAGQVIRDVCRENGCRLAERGVDFDAGYLPPEHVENGPALGRLDFGYRVPGQEHRYRGIGLRLLGRHQADNAAVALAVIAELRTRGWTVPEEAVRRGLAEVQWPARIEVLSRRPVVVIDAAHNRASVEALIGVLNESFSVRQRRLVFASTQGKDLPGMLQLLTREFDSIVFTRYLSNPRAVPPEDLQSVAEGLSGRRYPAYSMPAEAWQALRAMAGPEDLICVTGSFFIAAEIRSLAQEGPVAS
jgi:dihydrofolate synthase/folylpolyglutamate synthase